MTGLEGLERDLGALYTPKEAAKILRQKEKTLTNWRSAGRGPKYLKYGNRIVYPGMFLSAYLLTQVRDPAAKRQTAVA